MTFKKINTKEEIEKACENNPKLKKELNASDIEYELIKQAFNCRKDKGITQKEVSEVTGLSQELIAKMEQVGHTKSLESFIKYVDTLGLRIKLEKRY